MPRGGWRGHPGHGFHVKRGYWVNYRCSGPALGYERCGSVTSKPPLRPGNMESGNGSAQDAWRARVKGVLRSPWHVPLNLLHTWSTRDSDADGKKEAEYWLPCQSVTCRLMLRWRTRIVINPWPHDSHSHGDTTAIPFVASVRSGRRVERPVEVWYQSTHHHPSRGQSAHANGRDRSCSGI